MNATVRPLRSGGAIVSINGVDRFVPHWRAAVDEVEARTPRPTVDYPDACTPGADNADVNA